MIAVPYCTGSLDDLDFWLSTDTAAAPGKSASPAAASPGPGADTTSHGKKKGKNGSKAKKAAAAAPAVVAPVVSEVVDEPEEEIEEEQKKTKKGERVGVACGCGLRKSYGCCVCAYRNPRKKRKVARSLRARQQQQR